MHFLHIVVETVLNSRQRTFLDLVDRFFLQRESDHFYFINGMLALPSIGLCWSCNIHISDTSINQQRKHRPMFTFVVAKLIFGSLKVLISGSELGLSVTEPKKLSHHSMSHLWDSLSCHFSKIDMYILVSMDANWKESGKGELRSGNITIEVYFSSRVTFSSIISFYLSETMLCTLNFIIDAGFL